LLKLSVLSGPDSGKTQVFHARRVSIGKDSRNDFRLRDEEVSRFHGVFEQTEGNALRYRDLNSAAGSVLRLGERSQHIRGSSLNLETAAGEGFQLRLGQSLVLLELLTGEAERSTHQPIRPIEAIRQRSQSLATPTPISLTPLASMQPTPAQGTPSRADVVSAQMASFAPAPASRSAEEPAFNIVRRVSKDSAAPTFAAEQLRVLFRVSRELNALNSMDEILQRVAAATFELFPNANFFAIVVHDEELSQFVPIYSQVRAGTNPNEHILSQSLLTQVVEQREAVLYVRGSREAMNPRRSIVMAQISASMATPLFGQRKLMGVMQVDVRGNAGGFHNDDIELFTVMGASTAFAMERAELSENVFQTFEAFVNASVAAIDARDPATAGHSQRVAELTQRLALAVCRCEDGPYAAFSMRDAELVELRYAALLHDFGKIGVRESVLQKASRLAPSSMLVLLQRIETAFQQAMSAPLERSWQSLKSEQRAPTSQDHQVVERERAELRRSFAAYRELVQRLQGPTRLTPADVLLLQEMRSCRFEQHGLLVELLSAQELEELSISHGTLSAEERAHVESHAALSREYLSRIPWSKELERIPLLAGQHHEKLDGSGYPDGLGADAIIPQVRMLTICDIFDALTSTDRPYRRAFDAEQALDVLRFEAQGGKLDADLLELFARDVVSRLEPARRG
jgi:3',5'-cyclic-nucleotide phosphodiesterase